MVQKKKKKKKSGVYTLYRLSLTYSTLPFRLLLLLIGCFFWWWQNVPPSTVQGSALHRRCFQSHGLSFANCALIMTLKPDRLLRSHEGQRVRVT